MPKSEPRTLVLSTAEKLDAYLRRAHPILANDTELKGLRRHHDLLGLAFYDGHHNPVFANTEHFFDGIPLDELRDVCNAHFPRFKGIAHNAKFDLGVFRRLGIVDIPLLFDTSLLCHIHNPDNLKNLETRVKQDLKINKPTYAEITGKKWDKIHWINDLYGGHDKKGKWIEPCITLDNMAQYSGADVYYTWRLMEFYVPLLEKDNLLRIHDKIEKPLAIVLRDMQEAGVRIDLKVLMQLSQRLHKQVGKLNTEIYDAAGCVFNMNSSQQVADVLFNRLGLPVQKSTKAGKPSTDKHVLEALSGKHPVVDLLQEHSQVTTLISGFVDKIPALMDEDGRLRCDFNSDGARTGRMSSSNPNLQNQPNNPKYSVRSAFIPKPGHVFVIADYSQIEPRVMAHVSNDKKLREIYYERGDIYIGIAEELGIERKAAKIVQLAISYGMGWPKLANSLKVNEREAKGFIAEYYRKFNGLDAWKKRTEELAARNGEIRNMFGRVRRLPNARKPEERGFYFQALRQAVNTMIQGSAADIMKLAMIKLHKALLPLPAELLLVVHDEVIVETPAHLAEEVLHIVQDAMENVVKLDVPIIAEGKICRTWADMKDDSFKGLTREELLALPTSVRKEVLNSLDPTLLFLYGLI